MKGGRGAKGVGGRENGAGKGGSTAIRLNCNPSPLPSPFSRYSTSHLQRRVASADPAVLCNYLKTFWLPCARTLPLARARARFTLPDQVSLYTHPSVTNYFATFAFVTRPFVCVIWCRALLPGSYARWAQLLFNFSLSRAGILGNGNYDATRRDFVLHNAEWC